VQTLACPQHLTGTPSPAGAPIGTALTHTSPQAICGILPLGCLVDNLRQSPQCLTAFHSIFLKVGEWAVSLFLARQAGRQAGS